MEQGGGTARVMDLKSGAQVGTECRQVVTCGPCMPLQVLLRLLLPGAHPHLAPCFAPQGGGGRAGVSFESALQLYTPSCHTHWYAARSSPSTARSGCRP